MKHNFFYAASVLSFAIGVGTLVTACAKKEDSPPVKTRYEQAVELTKETEPTESSKTARTNTLVETWKDPVTGCEYLIIAYGKAVTPRIEAKGALRRQICNEE